MSDVKNRVECPGSAEGQRDLAPLYLAGKLTEKEAVAFEAHYLGCAKCREDITTGAALRELYGKPAVAASASASIDTVSSRRKWLPLAAAAAIAFIGLGVWQAVRRSPAPSVLRSGSADGTLAVKIESGSRGSLKMAWTSHPGAAVYVAQAFTRDGASVWKSESREPRLEIEAAALPRGDGAGLTIQIEAIDAMGRVVASSELVPVPIDRER